MKFSWFEGGSLSPPTDQSATTMSSTGDRLQRSGFRLSFRSAPSRFGVRISSFEMSYQLLRDDPSAPSRWAIGSFESKWTPTNAYRRIQTHTNQSAPIRSFRKELILLNRNPVAAGPFCCKREWVAVISRCLDTKPSEAKPGIPNDVKLVITSKSPTRTPRHLFTLPG